MTTVAVNLMWLVPDIVGGTEELLCGYLRAIAAAAPADLDITLFVQPGFAEAYPDLADAFDVVVARVGPRSRANRVLWEATWLERRTRSFDVVHHGGGVVPRASANPVLLTLHDLQPLDAPAMFAPVKRRWLAHRIPRSVELAALVHTTSQFVADGVRRRFDLPAERTVVIPPVITPASPVDPVEALRVLAEHEITRPFILYPAVTHPHKNHSVLLQAFDLLRSRDVDVELVLTGSEGAAEAAVRRASGPGVHRLGRVPRRELDTLLRMAAGLAFPSQYEGFGLPLVEAMQARCPVIAADAAALPEVAGDAALLVAPQDVEAWADAMVRVLRDESLRARLVAAGLERVEAFDPVLVVEGLLSTYRALGTSAP